MPFTSGTAATPSLLLKAINDFIVANGWTKLRGEEDMAVASPKAARYWRIVAYEQQTTGSNNYGVQLLNFRTTAGGANVTTNSANWSLNSLGTGTTSLLVSGGVVRSATINPGPWILTYDFGSPTIVREVYMRGDTSTALCIRDFMLQWSNDGEVWTTMREWTGNVWTASEFKTFTIADGFVHTRHAGANAPRRSGRRTYWTDYSLQWTTTAFERDMSNDTWIWQGPGYDATRRVYVHARGFARELDATCGIEWNYATAHDGAIPGFGGQAGSVSNPISGGSVNARALLFDSGTINYWLYVNSRRIVLVTRSGAQDYTSAYVGFLSAFGTPDQYPFPLFMSATSLDFGSFTHGSSNNRLSMCADPGQHAGMVKLWDGLDITVGNRPDSAATNFYISTSSLTNLGWVWPYFTGATNSNSYPEALMSSNSNDHFLGKMVATQQGHLPLFPAMVQNNPYGNIGVMDGVFCIPGAGLTPLQVITLSGVNYRVFPNRTRRDGNNWMAVRED